MQEPHQLLDVRRCKVPAAGCDQRGLTAAGFVAAAAVMSQTSSAAADSAVAAAVLCQTSLAGFGQNCNTAQIS